MAAIDKHDLHIDPAACQPLATLAAVSESLVARMVWGLSAMVLVLAWAVATGGALWIITQSLTDRPLALRARLAGLAAAVAVALFAWQDPLTIRRLEPVLNEAFAFMRIDLGPLLLRLFSSVLVGAAVLLAIAASSTLARPREEAPSPRHLAAQTQRLRQVLFLAATMLVAGTMQTAAMHRLPATLCEGDAREALAALGQGVSATAGTIWTLLILAFYLPAAMILRRRALTLAEAAEDGGEPDQIAKWLAEQGMESTLWQQLARLGAIVSPFLMGGPLTALLDLLRS